MYLDDLDKEKGRDRAEAVAMAVVMTSIPNLERRERKLMVFL